jgi:EAL domain-containing protein (putative c-di-GMP-specific phosphodiesterase class I)/GGDEF domain-containing protein
MMNATQLFEWMQDHTKAVKIAAVPLLLVMMVCVYPLVIYTGGIKYVYSHSMYLPVILAALIFGIRGGILAGALGGFILGPFVPINVITGEPQELSNWLFRTGFLILVGFLIGAASDSTQKYLERIRWIMNHDMASGLFNRMALVDVMRKISFDEENQPHYALAIVSIDNVLEIETAYSPEFTDEMIVELAARLGAILPAGIVMYRTNTHQLGMLLPANANHANEALLDELTEATKQPFIFENIPIHGDIRIGYAELSTLEDEPERYLRRAEVALRTAVEQARSWVRFIPELDNSGAKKKLELLSELKAAIGNGQMSLHYQPKIFMKSGIVQGVEALMRWQHPEQKEITPEDFLPRAENSVLLDLLTEWSIDNALAQHTQWKKAGLELPVAVNISPRNLLQGDFVDMVLRLLEAHQVGGKMLELEVTEGALMINIERTIMRLRELSRVNIAISIDDFGTGYSSLQYLNSLPATTIKIDRTFIRALSENTSSKHIVEAAINLAHGLEMKVVAEGVEDKASYDFLAGLGCDIAQGYFISHPVPASQIPVWFETHNGKSLSSN